MWCRLRTPTRRRKRSFNFWRSTSLKILSRFAPKEIFTRKPTNSFFSDWTFLLSSDCWYTARICPFCPAVLLFLWRSREAIRTVQEWLAKCECLLSSASFTWLCFKDPTAIDWWLLIYNHEPLKSEAIPQHDESRCACKNIPDLLILIFCTGHPEYGCFISREKTLTNFDYDAQILNVTEPKQKCPHPLHVFYNPFLTWQ